MPTPYVVQDGDWGAKIAQQHGFSTFGEIYNHSANTDFRKKRPNPNKIFPGDIIMIPEKVIPPSGGGGGGGGSSTVPQAPPMAPPQPGPTTTGKIVIALKFDTLCSIAVEEGFVNCAPLRGDPANAQLLNRALEPGDKVHIPPRGQGTGSGVTEQKHTFQRKGKPFATIRFVHGTPNLQYKDDPELDHLDVSNYVTDLAGANRQQPFANEAVRQFEQHAHDDPDTFKVEVFDMRTKKNELPVEIDAMKPVYNQAGDVNRHELFPGDRKTANTEANKRSLNVSALKQGGSTRYRSCYLRLVVDANDHGTGDPRGRALQTLLVTDMTEAAQAADTAGKTNDAAEFRKVEILDQAVRAKYEIDGCPAPSTQTKCHVTCQVPVGHEKKKVKMVVNVLRRSRGGTGWVTVQQATDWVRKYIRWLYAQSNMSVDLISPFVRLIQPPTNMIAVSSPRGNRANGGSKIKVGIKVDNAAEVEAEITTVANNTPMQTADQLAAAIRAVLPNTVQVRTSENPRNPGRSRGSADILIGAPLTQKVELRRITNADSSQKIQIGEITGETVTEFGGDDSSTVGTLHERVLIKNYDTGVDRLDVFIVGNLSDGSWGEAFRPKGENAPEDKPNNIIVNTVIMRRHPIETDVVHTTLAHEGGHVLMDIGHVTGEPTEMMGAGSPVGDNEKVVEGPKRISDPAVGNPQINFGSGVVASGNPTTLLRTQNANLITNW